MARGCFYRWLCLFGCRQLLIITSHRLKQTDEKLKKDAFHLPEGVVYLDGNSLGPLPLKAVDRISSAVFDEWGELLIKGWNDADWMEMPSRIGNRVARLIGAAEGSVVLGDTLSVKVFQALSAAFSLNPSRKKILSDTGNFPSDLYMAEGLIAGMNAGLELVTVSPEAVDDNIDETVAVLMPTEVDYRTGRKHNMTELTRTAHNAGVVTIWDLAHSAGAFPVDLTGCQADFAVGCTYKYLNGGPGAPAFIYVRSDLVSKVQPVLSGWLGHKEPFAFHLSYQPASAIERMRVGTPPVLQMAALDAALDIWDEVSLNEIREKSILLSELFIEQVEKKCHGLELASPRNPIMRGSQVSFSSNNGYAVMRALIDRNVVGDFRAPDLLRFGFTPLYLDEADIMKAVTVLEEIVSDRLWDREEYHKRQRVT